MDWLLTSFSKKIQREQSSLSSEKELRVNTMQTLGDELHRKTLKLGELRGKQQQQKMDEATLKEYQDSVAVLQRELKVSKQRCALLMDRSSTLQLQLL